MNSVKKFWIISVLVAAALVFVAGNIVMYILPLDLRDPSPVQPIAFSHKLHAGTNGIPCLFCHRYAATSSVAGIPAVADCRDCHRYIAAYASEIDKLMKYWERKEPIPWVRVYWLPDHVYFPHKMHIRAKIDCRTCHGDVAAMERITRKVHLKMGWCLGCHRQHKANIDCWTCHI